MTYIITDENKSNILTFENVRFISHEKSAGVCKCDMSNTVCIVPNHEPEYSMSEFVNIHSSSESPSPFCTNMSERMLI